MNVHELLEYAIKRRDAELIDGELNNVVYWNGYIDCQAWRQTAEFVTKYFSKGNAICVIGSLQKRAWETKNGEKRYTVEVVVDEALFVDCKDSAQGALDTTGDQTPAPTFTKPVEPNFEAVNVDADDLPF